MSRRPIQTSVLDVDKLCPAGRLWAWVQWALSCCCCCCCCWTSDTKLGVSEKPGASTHPSKGAECTTRPRRGTPDRKSSSGLTSALIFTCFTCEFSTGGGLGCQHFFFPFTPSRTFSLHPSPHSFSSPYSKCVSSERNRPHEITPLSVVFFSPAPVDVKNLPADQPASGLWFPL